MNFRPELAIAVVEGRKTVTRRVANLSNPRSPWWVERCGLKVGRDYAVCPGRGKTAIARALVTDTHLRTLGFLTEQAAALEGFASEAEFRATFEKLNGGYCPDTLVWRVEFRLVDPC